MSENEYKSKKSRSTFVARGEKDRAYLVVTGEASRLPIASTTKSRSTTWSKSRIRGRLYSWSSDCSHSA